MSVAAQLASRTVAVATMIKLRKPFTEEQFALRRPLAKEKPPASLPY